MVDTALRDDLVRSDGPTALVRAAGAELCDTGATAGVDMTCDFAHDACGENFPYSEECIDCEGLERLNALLVGVFDYFGW